MTTENDFQNQLDANPDDHHTRLVFADWLQERGDPRAEGYRALGLWRRVPFRRPRDWSFCYGFLHPAIPHWLSASFRLHPSWSSQVGSRHVAPTRRELENVVASAFAWLPADIRAELLAVEALA